MNEKLNDFLAYGMDSKIEKKQIYNMDGVISFITFLVFVINEIYGGAMWARVGCVLFPLSFIIFTFTRRDVTGKKIFWIYGIWGIGFSILFGVIGTIFMFLIIDKKYYITYLGIMVILYIIVLCIYISIICYLIKKEIYSSKSSKKLMGGWCFLLCGIAGMSFAKILGMNTSQEKIIQIVSVLSYLISLISVLGSLNMIKYFMIKRREKTISK